jgi:hypothetical protein
MHEKFLKQLKSNRHLVEESSQANTRVQTLAFINALVVVYIFITCSHLVYRCLEYSFTLDDDLGAKKLPA